MLRKKAGLIFIFLSIVNLVILFAWEYFQYRSYASYRSLYQVCDLACSEKWSRLIDDYPPGDFVQTKKITDSIISDSVSGYDKMLRLGNFFSQQFNKRTGRPSGNPALSPLELYQHYMASDTLKPGSKQLANMFSYFCWTQDIACRNIGIRHGDGELRMNECYIPELGRWVMVDISDNVLAVRNKTGAFLDLQGVKDSMQKKSELRLYTNEGDTVTRKLVSTDSLNRRYLSGGPVHYYHRTNMEKINSFSERINRYFFPDPWYDILEETKQNNWLFQVKRVLFVLWILSFFVFLISRTKFRL